MNVYILECGEFDEKYIYGVYSTEDKAKQAAKQSGYDIFTITEYGIDAELTA